MNKHTLNGVSIFLGLLSLLSILVWTFTGYTWWVPAPSPSMREFMIAMFHFLFISLGIMGIVS